MESGGGGEDAKLGVRGRRDPVGGAGHFERAILREKCQQRTTAKDCTQTHLGEFVDLGLNQPEPRVSKTDDSSLLPRCWLVAGILLYRIYQIFFVLFILGGSDALGSQQRSRLLGGRAWPPRSASLSDFLLVLCRFVSISAR